MAKKVIVGIKMSPVYNISAKTEAIRLLWQKHRMFSLGLECQNRLRIRSGIVSKPSPPCSSATVQRVASIAVIGHPYRVLVATIFATNGA